MHRFFITFVACVLSVPLLNFGDELSDDYRTGKYENALKKVDYWGNIHTKFQLLKTVGQYQKAFDIWAKTNSKSYDISVLVEGIEILQLLGKEKEAGILQAKAKSLVEQEYNIYKPIHFVTCGNILLQNGTEPRKVLSNYYESALREDPTLKQAYLSAADLCFSKDDMQAAAHYLQRGLKHIQDDPDILYYLARTFQDNDAKYYDEIIQKINNINPLHIPTLSHLAYNSLLKNDPKTAKELLDKWEKLNPNSPELLSLKSCYELMTGNDQQASFYKSAALKSFTQNPQVDLTIGNYLSYKGFFEKSNTHLRAALRLAPDNTQVKVGLAMNLLRLGKTTESFELAQKIYEQDPYNLTAYNLVQLHDSFKNLQVIETDHFIIRMHPDEAKIYANDVTALLAKAHKNLNQKYGFQQEAKVYVDFFDDADDFAIRNFAYPLEFGALGVCFGNVITMKSFNAMDETRNWRETLWHEYAHVVTLGLSKKKVSRWFTEGISVYEEWLGPDEWGMVMTPQFRTKILKGEIYPIAKLNKAFHGPDALYAYFQSGHLIKFLVDKYGFVSIRNSLEAMVLASQSKDALKAIYGDIDKIDREFSAHLQELAENTAPEADFTQPDKSLSSNDAKAISKFLIDSPNNIPVLYMQAALAISKRNFKTAEKAYSKIIALYPEMTERNNPYLPLADLYREQKMFDEELDIRKYFHQINANYPQSLIRLIELLKETKKLDEAAKFSRQLIGLLPASSIIYKTLAEKEIQDGGSKAVDYYQKALLCPDLQNSTEVHFTLAKILKDEEPAKAKRHLLKCLEAAPRYRKAYKLLQEMK